MFTHILTTEDKPSKSTTLFSRSKSYGYKDSAMSKEKHYIVRPELSRTGNMELKTILKKLIKEKGITITSLSRSTKVPLQTLHGWLQGSEPKSLKQVKKVADYLKVDLDYLCFGIEPKAHTIKDYQEEINAGIFEVVLRRVKK